jgi:hypothetical protein
MEIVEKNNPKLYIYDANPIKDQTTSAYGGYGMCVQSMI